MSNSIDPDEMAHMSRLIWIYAVCKSLFFVICGSERVKLPTVKLNENGCLYISEILGALISILFLWVVTGVLVYMGVERCIDRDFEVEATVMLITAGCGVAFNLV